jgi:hypothetical protein
VADERDRSACPRARRDLSFDRVGRTWTVCLVAVVGGAFVEAGGSEVEDADAG